MLHQWFRIQVAGEVVPSILVAVPGIFAAYLFTPGQHRLLRKLFVGLRIVVLLLSAISFLAGIFLALRLSPGVRPSLWYLLTGLATLALIAVGGAVLSSWLGSVPIGARKVGEV
jgi:hypothetical protein